MSDRMWSQLPEPDSSTALRVQVVEVGGVPTVFVAGDLDMTVTAQMKDALNAACSLAGNLLVVDVSGVTFIDVAGLRVLVSTHNLLLRRGRTGIVVRGAPRIVRRMFGLTGFTSLLDDSPSDGAGQHRSVRDAGPGRELEDGRRYADLSLKNMFLAYFALGGTADFPGMAAHLGGIAEVLDPHQRDVAAHAVNERLTELGRTEYLLSYEADQRGSPKGPE